MAKKKRKPDGKKPQHRAPSQTPVGLPSRRAMEGVMRQLVADLQGTPTPTPDTPLAQAQHLIDEAFDEPNPQRRVAREALRLGPDCADAHVLLAEHAPTRKQALAHYERGAAAGERAFGPDASHQHRTGASRSLRA